MFGFYFLETCPFLMRNKNGVDPEGKGDRKELGGAEGEKTIIRIDCMSKESLFNKRKGKHANKKIIRLKNLRVETFMLLGEKLITSNKLETNLTIWSLETGSSNLSHYVSRELL